MTLILSGTDGLSDVDGSAATPAVRGTDTNTGLFFPAADTIAFAEGGVEVARITNTGAWSFGASGTATGTNGQVLTSAGSAAAPAWQTPGGGANLQEFTSSGTWTKPAGATFVMVECWGAGGGGGSGRRGAAGSLRLGGTGAGGGAYTQRLFKASDLASTVSVTIGAGGIGGAAVTTDSLSGNPGTNGGNTTFGTHLTGFGGGFGGGGLASGPTRYGGDGGGALSAGVGTSGGGGAPYLAQNAGQGHFGSPGQNFPGQEASGWGGARGAPSTDDSILNPGGCSFQGGPGGGSGGIITSTNTTTSGSDGGSVTGSNGGGGAGGTSGGAGVAGTGRQGGGGGGASTSAAAGAGGAGGQPAGGGGGGGASANGNNSGAGGAGGAGLCRVYTW